ncbi:putative MFS-type transporter [Geobacter sp. OR-1]|uniref:MFS transporter n=1 Tax=Geobacter sp. OR-1 TaxID=1266765 RepID=UPI000541EAB8|nr:MFS transporter [Geobacter sp. OR-1]GAM10349.1 putative MFS-type transporter [Geobacter sp. OR-1]
MAKDQPSLTPFLMICLIGFLSFLSSYLRMPVLPLYAATLGAGPAEVGVINGAYLLTAGLFSIPSGLLADRIGRTLPIVVGIVAMAISSLLIPLCSSPVQMAAAYVLFGGGIAAFGPSMLSLVADVMPSGRLGQAYGWYTSVIYVAMTVGPAAGGFLAKSIGLREVFIISGSGSLAVAFLALFFLPKSPPRHRSDMHSVLTASFELLHNQWLISCLIATVGSCVAFGVFFTFLPLYATSCGYDPAQVGMLFAAQALTNVVSRIPIGFVADRIDRRLIINAGLFCIAVALIAMGQTVQLIPLLICSIVLGAGMALAYTAIGVLIAEQVPAMQRGLAMGMYNSCIFLGMMTGSTVMGVALKKIGYPLGFAISGGVALISLVWFASMLRKAQRDTAPR